MNDWQRAQRQARRIGQSTRPAQSVHAWAQHVLRALGAQSSRQ